MKRSELIDQLDTTFRQLVADKSPATQRDIERVDDISTGLGIWAMNQTEQLAARRGKKLWVDDVQAAKATAERSRN